MNPVAHGGKPEEVPVILLGGEAIALSAARSYGRRGIRVYVLDGPTSYARHSRYATWIPAATGSSVQEEWLEWLTNGANRLIPGALLLPCCDDGLELIARHRGELERTFVMAEADDSVTLALLDKEQTSRLAERTGTPAPTTWRISSTEEILDVIRTISFPCALKPRHSHLFARHFPAVKLFVARNGDQLMEYFLRVQSYGLEMIVTQIIPGGDDQYYSYYTHLDTNGRPLFHFTKRKLRQYPPGFGDWTYHVSGVYPDVAARGLQFFQKIGLRGIGTVEFKRDSADGELKLIECNPRFTNAIELLRYSGIEWALLVYNHILGRPIPPIGQFREHVRVIRPISDLLAFRDLRSSGVMSLAEWMKSILHRQHFQYLRWYDPLPSLVRIGPTGRRFVQKLFPGDRTSPVPLQRPPAAEADVPALATTHRCGTRPCELGIREVRTLEEMRSLQPVWDVLLSRADRPEVYLTFEWMLTWWKCLGGKGKDLLILVVTEGEESIGIVPLMRSRGWSCGLPARSIRFISSVQWADTPSNCPATLDVIALPGRSVDVLNCLFRHLSDRRIPWDIIHLTPIPQSSPTTASLVELARQHGYPVSQSTVFKNSYLQIATGWEEYYSSLSSHFRKRLLCQEHKLEALGKFRLDVFSEPAVVERALKDIMEIEKHSWKWDSGVSLNSAALNYFYHEFAREASKKGWLSLWVMSAGNRKIAYDYLVNYEGQVEVLKGSFDEEFRRYSPGILLTLKEFDTYLHGKVRRIGLLWGDDLSKRRWGCESEPHHELWVCNNTLYGRTLHILVRYLRISWVQKLVVSLWRRLARKLNIRLRNSELTRLDQLIPRGTNGARLTSPESSGLDGEHAVGIAGL
jgi:D-aspartate ligase